MYARLLAPPWIVRHVIVIVVVGLFALAGVWQIHRLRERREHNSVVAARRSAPEAELADALRNPATAEHRRVFATGRYDVAREVVLLRRGDESRPGNHVLTPLVERGRAVIVDRGWVPATAESPPVADAAPPSGTVTVRGELLASERAPLGGTGVTKVVSLIDVRRLARQLPYPVAPLYVRLSSQSPPQAGELPVPVRARPLSSGRHLAYAVQWFLFIAISLVGYGAFIRRETRLTAAQPAGEG